MCNKRMLAIAASLVAVSSLGPVRAADVERVVVLRDGTILKLALPDELLPWRRMTEDGRVFEEPVRLSEIQHLRLVRTPATDQVAVVRKLAAQLGDADFNKREAAQAELVKMGGKFRSILSEYVLRAADMEVKWRLNVLLKTLPTGQGLIDFDYDQLAASSGEKPLPGDVGSWSMKTKYRGLELALDRVKVAALGEIPLAPLPAPEAPAGRVRRIEANEDALFPPQVTRIDFERGPRGEELSDDRDIASIFAPLGCTFAVLLPDAYVSVQSYNVGGRSGGKCAATFKPRYQGTMLIKFCVPEHERIPAAVRNVGLSVSHVSPGGTILQAFDAHHRLLGEVRTTRTGSDFLALKSIAPIAYAKVVPVPEIDKDFAIDDLVFDPPQPLAESGDAERFSALLTNGERLYCGSVDTKNGTVIMKELSFGAPELVLPAADVAAILTPQRPAPAADAAKECFVRLVDGSLLRANSEKGLACKRFPKLTLSAENMAAFWGGNIASDLPDDDAWPADGTALLLPRAQPPKPLTKWKLGASWIESPDVGEASASTYATSPPVWLKKPLPRAAESGLLRLTSGEELVLAPVAFVLKSWSAEGVVLSRGTEEVRISMSEMASLVFARPESGAK